MILSDNKRLVLLMFIFLNGKIMYGQSYSEDVFESYIQVMELREHFINSEKHNAIISNNWKLKSGSDSLSIIEGVGLNKNYGKLVYFVKSNEVDVHFIVMGRMLEDSIERKLGLLEIYEIRGDLTLNYGYCTTIDGLPTIDSFENSVFINRWLQSNSEKCNNNVNILIEGEENKKITFLNLIDGIYSYAGESKKKRLISIFYKDLRKGIRPKSHSYKKT